MYLTMSPLIIGGILNMVFTKTKTYKRLARPIDCQKILKDGKRIFGDNKTTVGFVSMVVLCAVLQSLVGYVCSLFEIETYNDLYCSNSNNIIFNLCFGASVGFVYMLFELPNSFIKRRLNIAPGETTGGGLGVLFFIIDQIDSLIGVMALLCIVANLSFVNYVQYVLVGGITHIAINITLYFLKIRRNV